MKTMILKRRYRSFSFVLLGLVLAVGAAAQPPAQPPAARPTPAPTASPAGPSPSFPSQVELVTVDVVVTDKKGAPIAGLTRDSFSVSEDGTPQSIASFEAITVPPTASVKAPERPRVSVNTDREVRTGRSFVIVFDDIHLTPFMAQRAKGAVAEFLRSGVREGDLVTLVATGGGAWWSTRMEAGREELITMLKRLDGRHIPDTSPDRMSEYEAMKIHVYRDQTVEARVSRRFETYGVSARNAGGSSDTLSSTTTGDPLVEARAADVYYQSVTKNRITLQVLERVLNSLAPTKGRKSLLLVSEGFIMDTNLDEFKRVVQNSRRSNVAIYFVDTRGLGGMPEYFTAAFGPAIDTQDIGAAFMEDLEASEGSESLASDTGGFSVKNTNDLNKGIQRIADESRTYYLLGYNSTNTARDGRFRKIQVKVAEKNIQVRARKGYYAPLEGGKSALDRKPEAGDPQIQAALDSPYEEDAVPLRMTSYVFAETLLGKANVLVATDVDLRGFAFQENEGRALDTLDFLLVVAHRETGEYFRYDQKIDMKLLPETRQRMARTWFPIVRDFELATGGYQAKIVVRDKNSGRIGTVVHEFEVPDLSQFRVSSPVLSDTLQPAPEGSKERPTPALLARRTFASGSMLYSQFEVYGAAKDKQTGMPRVSAGYVIRRKDGTVVTQTPASLINPTSIGKLSRMIGVQLENATPGEYELVLGFKDEISGKTLELREPFIIAAAAAAGSTGG
jgi:VWFA-related protein